MSSGVEPGVAGTNSNTNQNTGTNLNINPAGARTARKFDMKVCMACSSAKAGHAIRVVTLNQ